MNYENKTNEELTELLEERDQSIEDLNDEITSDAEDAKDYDRAIKDLSTIAEKSFYAGYNTIKKPMNDLKAWLNYKMEARL